MSRANRAAISVFCGIVVLAILVAAPRWFSSSPQQADSGSAGDRNQVSESLAQQVQELIDREEATRQALWKHEVLAQAYGAVIESIWDELNSELGGLRFLENLTVETVNWGGRELLSALRSDIRVWRPLSETPAPLKLNQWRGRLEEAVAEGWELESSEFRHVRFDLAANGVAEQSEFYCRVSLVKRGRERMILEGPLVIDWTGSIDEIGRRSIERVDFSGLEIRASSGECPFEVVLEEAIAPPVNAHAIDPLLVHDLDGDGTSEIILANCNLVFRLDDRGTYFGTPLCTFPPGLISSAVLGDFDGDGSIDLLCTKHEGMVLMKGSAKGVFDQRERLVWPNNGKMPYPMVLSSGDIDRDGDLDVFVGQYRVPYDGGSLPTPYHDANDGPPAYLLRNEGNLEFTDITDQTSLTTRRHRRVYSASLVDLDDLPGVDLVVVSDFAGADYYRSSGQFQILSSVSESFGDSLGFGMAHTFSDFNRDGVLDVLMIGMNSPTVDRLEHFGLRREGLNDEPTMRARMVQGNRLFLSSGSEDRFTQDHDLSRSIARSGWAWGCGAGDFDNDGYCDVFVGNGLESRESVRDYESEYWLHDAFVADSENNSVAYLYFKEKFERTRGAGHSYGGFESNRLYLNHQAKTFLEVGSLWCVGIQRDTRNVVVQDFDGDGGMDIALIHFEVWPEPKQTLKVYRNRLTKRGNWIGFRFASAEGQALPAGAKVTLRSDSFQLIDEIVSGDSYRSQHDTVLHFGLGELKSIPEVTVRWAEGTTSAFENLEANRYYWVRPGEVEAITDKE